MTAVTSLVMGTRGSPLALAQSRQVAGLLELLHPALKVEERVIRTTGDRRQAESLPAIGGKGVFTEEIEAALLEGEIDFAVHSLKDLPPAMAEGLALAAVPERESAADALILRSDHESWPEAEVGALKQLPFGARVGTSSLRRRALLLAARPDLEIVEVRGNVDTRLRKLEEQNLHAVVLARAGLNRLHLVLPTAFDLAQNWFLPAPGQGALGIQARHHDVAVRAVLLALDDPETRACAMAERAVVKALGAGCSTPLGALAHALSDSLALQVAVLSPDGKERVGLSVEGSGDPELIGRSAAQKLLEKGAGRLLYG